VCLKSPKIFDKAKILSARNANNYKADLLVRIKYIKDNGHFSARIHSITYAMNHFTAVENAIIVHVTK